MRIPNMLEIVTALEEGAAKNRHAKNAFAAADDRSAAEAYAAAHQKECIQLKEEALACRSHTLGSLQYRTFRQFDTTGARDDYQEQYFAHRRRLNTEAMAWYLFRDEEALEDAQDAIWAVCDEYTWCLPAHLGGRSLEILPDAVSAAEKDGEIVSYEYSHPHRLDLFACETAKQLAEALRLLGGRAEPAVRHRAVEEIIHRVFNQYLTFNQLSGFETDLSNWSAVCGGSLGIAALYLIEEARLLAPVLQRVISDLDVFLSSYGEDGIGKEGLGYWRYGFLHFCMFADLLKERTAGAIDLFADEKVKRVAFFPANAYLYGELCPGFSDGRDRCECPTELISYLKEVYPDMPQVTAASKQIRRYPGRENGDSSVTLRKIFWNKPLQAELFRERSDYFPDAQWLVSCTGSEKTDVSFVIKGGTNGEPHNHNDLGHFVVLADSEALLCDLGGGLYTKDYFGTGRYRYLVNSSRGHSVPIVDGVLQKEGEESRAVILGTETGTERDCIAMELKSAYPVKGLESLIRSAELDRKTQRLTITDCFRFTDGEPHTVTSRFVSKFRPVIKDKTVVITGSRHRLILTPVQLPEEIIIDGEEYQTHDRGTAMAYFVDLSYRCRDSLEMSADLRIELL